MDEDQAHQFSTELLALLSRYDLVLCADIEVVDTDGNEHSICQECTTQ